MQKVSPDQDRMCCLEVPEAAEKQFCMLGHPQAVMLPKKPCGKDKVRKEMKAIAQWLKLTDWEYFRGQALSTFIAMKLGSDDSASIAESIAALQHRWAAAYKHWNKTSGASECDKYKALGIIKKK